MNAEEETRLIEDLDRRLAHIHGLKVARVAIGDDRAKEADMNVRHEEFQAMADVFLGESYDRAKLDAVEKLQIATGELQINLLAQLDQGSLTPGQYVDRFNDELAECFANIERILGADDFLRLFGAPRDQVGGYIDKEAFVREHREVERQRRENVEAERP